MKAFIKKIKTFAIAGFLFLLPVFVIFVIVTKAWTALTSVGSKIAAVFGMKTIAGLGSATVFTGLLLIIICLVCGMLVVRFSFMKKFNKSVENGLMKYIPGYSTYKAMAEEKLQQKEKIIPYTPAFLKTENDLLQPVFIVEKDGAGNNIILVPAIPETNKGQILIVKEEKLEQVPSMSGNEFDELLKSMGKGLLSRRSVDIRIVPSH